MRKSGKYYPDKPWDMYNCYPFESVKDVRDSYGDFVKSTEGYAYFIVWIDLVPGNSCEVRLFADKAAIEKYKSSNSGNESDEERDWYHRNNSSGYLPIDGRNAEELNNYIAKILMDFYNKRIRAYIQKNSPSTRQSHHSDSTYPTGTIVFNRSDSDPHKIPSISEMVKKTKKKWEEFEKNKK